MIEYTIMDYDGEPVTIEDSTMYYWDAEDGQHWNSETLQFEDDEEEEEDCDDEPDWDAIPYGWHGNPYRRGNSDRKLYGMDWYDCN